MSSNEISKPQPDIVVVKELVDPIRVSSLILNNDFIALTSAIRIKNKRYTDIYTERLHNAGYEMKEIIAALERVG